MHIYSAQQLFQRNADEDLAPNRKPAVEEKLQECLKAVGVTG